MIIAALVVGFTVYCVIDAARSEGDRIRGLPRAGWIAVIVLVPVAGGLAWLFAGRPRSEGPRGGGGRRAGSSPPSGPAAGRGPDDDPDFLRGLDRRMRDRESRGPGRPHPEVPDGPDGGTPGTGQESPGGSPPSPPEQEGPGAEGSTGGDGRNPGPSDTERR